MVVASEIPLVSTVFDFPSGETARERAEVGRGERETGKRRTLFE